MLKKPSLLRENNWFQAQSRARTEWVGDILCQKGNTQRLIEFCQKDTAGTRLQGQSLAKLGQSEYQVKLTNTWITKNLWVYRDTHRKERENEAEKRKALSQRRKSLNEN